MIKRAHVIFKGEVQGVGFRFTARSIARELGVAGWVMNEASGEVALEAQAEEPVLQEFLERLNREFARHIQEAEVSWKEPDADTAGFEIRL